ncbi:MAG: hypothetical protein AABY22_20215 [Nanoarchaeota archaeon]
MKKITNEEAKDFWLEIMLEKDKIDLVDRIWESMTEKQRKEELNEMKEILMDVI